MSKPKENLFYFDQDDQPEEVSNPIASFTPNKIGTKQFHKIDDTNQLAKNFFERDNNIDQHKEVILTGSIKKKISRNVKLAAIPAMGEGNRKSQIQIINKETQRKQRDELEKKSSESSIEEPKHKLQELKYKDQSSGSQPQKEKKEKTQIVFEESQSEQAFDQRQKGHNQINRQPKSNESDQENLQTHNDNQEIQVDPNPLEKQLEAFIKISPSDIIDRKSFLTSQIQQGKVLECTVRRDKSGFNRFFPEYSLYTTDGVKYLMSSKKRTGNATSNYLISLDKNDLSSKGDNYLGKLRSNWVGTEFVGYDCGHAPDKPEKGRELRKELLQIYYESNFFGSKGPRNMNIYISKPPYAKEKESLKQISQKKGNAIHLVNKPPKWNPDTRTFVLNFNNRVDKPSVKNFILVQKDVPSLSNQQYALLFGRVSQDVFNLDVKYPLSPIQAFEIVLSSFDFKIACE